jgi:hypothetical protein
MAEENSFSSAFARLSRYGAVPLVAFLAGFTFLPFGLAGDVSFSNKKLMLGGILIVFGLLWRAFRLAWNGQKPRHILETLFFGAIEFFLISAYATGHVPFSS